MINENILLLAVAALQLTNTVSNILLTISNSASKLIKSQNEDLKNELDVKAKINKEQRADYKQLENQYFTVLGELQDIQGRYNELTQLPAKMHVYPTEVKP